MTSEKMNIEAEVEHTCWTAMQKYEEMKEHCAEKHEESCDGDTHTVVCNEPATHKKFMSFIRCGEFCTTYQQGMKR